MTEEFLHYLWKYKRFNSNELSTHSGEPVQLVKQGDHNTDAGPDFFNAKLKIGKTLWAGNVEIHLRSSDWKRHGHHQNNQYDSVILHVVYTNDEECYRSNGTIIPALVLPINASLITEY